MKDVDKVIQFEIDSKGMIKSTINQVAITYSNNGNVAVEEGDFMAIRLLYTMENYTNLIKLFPEARLVTLKVYGVDEYSENEIFLFQKTVCEQMRNAWAAKKNELINKKKRRVEELNTECADIGAMITKAVTIPFTPKLPSEEK